MLRQQALATYNPELRSGQQKTAFRIVLATGRDAVVLILAIPDRTWGSIELFGSLAV